MATDSQDLEAVAVRGSVHCRRSCPMGGSGTDVKVIGVRGCWEQTDVGTGCRHCRCCWAVWVA